MPYLCVLIYAVAFAGVAMTVQEGLWSNTLSLISILICGPLAIALGYPVGLMIQEKAGNPVEQTWYFVFGGVWLVFFFAIMIVRLLLDRVASRVRMKFVPPLELATGPIMGILVAAMFASFLAFTLYTIPIAAGEWPIATAADWQKTTMASGSSLFNTVLKAMAGEDVAQYHRPH
jgi:drug/metabolite transporter (DMT)-like permease